MKISGNVLEYSESDWLGYIKGYDDMVYLFHHIDVINKVNLKAGDLVKFDFIFTDDKNMPHAFDVEKIEL